jgi:hypothetical protein
MIAASSNDAQCGFTAVERILFNRIFEERLDAVIPALLFSLNPFPVIHALPERDKCANQLMALRGTQRANGDGMMVTPLEEFGDWVNLPSVDPLESIKTVETLAEQAATSYAWNVRNAYTKGGRVYPGDKKLHITDWKGAFKMNIVKNLADSCPGDNAVGWVAYHYCFAAAKV